jgi:hypothetical protein
LTVYFNHQYYATPIFPPSIGTNILLGCHDAHHASKRVMQSWTINGLRNAARPIVFSSATVQSTLAGVETLRRLGG